MSKNETDILKGFFALCVILHHLGQQNGLDGIFGSINGCLGGIAVGAFFFLSSYGLVQSYLKDKANYYKKIFLVKIPVLYLIQVSINLIYFLCFELNSGLSLTNILVRIFNFDIFFGFSRMNGYSWFITTILFVYLAFGFILLLSKLFKKYIKNNNLFIAISFTISIFISYCLVVALNFDTLYIKSIFCFLLGIWYSLYYVEINKFLQNKKVYYLSLITTIALIPIFFFFVNVFVISIEHTISLLICVLIIILSQKMTVESNKTYLFLGKISLAIYLLQLIWIYYLHAQLSIDIFTGGIAVISTTIVSAYLYTSIYNVISKSVSKLKNKFIDKRRI